MAFSYNADAPSTRDMVRLLIADTNAAAFIFQDGELDTFLLLATGASGATGNFAALVGAALAFETIARDRVKLMKLRQFGDERTERFQIADFLSAAQLLRDAANAGTVPLIGAITETGALLDIHGFRITPVDPRLFPL